MIKKEIKLNKPIVYIASPYTKGDVSINVHFQCKIFDELMDDGIVVPVVPLWSHFQHTIFPRQYKDWIAYDLALLCRYDACLRLDVINEKLNYHQHDSSGADGEVEEFRRLNKPVFFSKSELYEWVNSAYVEYWYRGAGTPAEEKSCNKCNEGKIQTSTVDDVDVFGCNKCDNGWVARAAGAVMNFTKEEK